MPAATKSKPRKRRTYVPKMHAAAALSDPYALCKDKGHAWEGIPQPIDVNPPRYGEPRYWRCPRCTAVCIEGIHRQIGSVESRRYKYPPGYLERKDQKIPKNTVRLEVLGRLQTYGTEWSLISALASNGNGKS